MILYGPFKQLLTMDHLPQRGHLSDENLEIIQEGGVLVNGERIAEIGSFKALSKKTEKIHRFNSPTVALPGLIDSHTHICFSGNRAHEYSMRLSGASYQEIAAAGGGILNTVKATRKASLNELIDGVKRRRSLMRKGGITSAEVKSGYGLTQQDELKMLQAIKQADPHLIRTCLAAHVIPPEFSNEKDYLEHVLNHLLPFIQREKLSSRLDIFVEQGAFSPEAAKYYLLQARKMGFSLTIHANQFSPGGAYLAAELGATSADHLEVCSKKEAQALAKAHVVATALPGASLGLGLPFTPARMLLDEGCVLAIASDWNPGSAPMGDLLTQAACLAAFEKLSMATTFAAITVRAAQALGFSDRGILKKGNLADVALFPTSNIEEILYNQGRLRPTGVIERGNLINFMKRELDDLKINASF